MEKRAGLSVIDLKNRRFAMNDKRKTVKDDKRPGRLVCVCSAKGEILYNAYDKLNRQKDKNRSENNDKNTIA